MRKAVFFAICLAMLAATAYGQSSSTMADDQVNASYLQGNGCIQMRRSLCQCWRRLFSNATYDSSERPTQFADAIQRAEFFHMSDDDWHTILKPRVATPRTMVLLKGTYQLALNADGSCCLFALIDENTFGNALFPSVPADTTTPIGAAENAGDIRTKDISTFLFPNAYLFSGNQCCVLGFHTYDIEPGSASNGRQERRYVLNYASWITPGLFGGGPGHHGAQAMKCQKRSTMRS